MDFMKIPRSPEEYFKRETNLTEVRSKIHK